MVGGKRARIQDPSCLGRLHQRVMLGGHRTTLYLYHHFCKLAKLVSFLIGRNE